MMFGYVSAKTHADVSEKRAQAEKDLAYWKARALTSGAVASGLLRDKERLEAVLATAYVRGPKGHFQRAELPRQDDKAASDRAIGDAWKAVSNG